MYKYFFLILYEVFTPLRYCTKIKKKKIYSKRIGSKTRINKQYIIDAIWKTVLWVWPFATFYLLRTIITNPLTRNIRIEINFSWSSIGNLKKKFFACSFSIGRPDTYKNHRVTNQDHIERMFSRFSFEFLE